jgi:drug/metabolite transporter (DMT)-like permease
MPQFLQILTPIPPLALVLVLIAACFHAGWNHWLHETPDRVAAMTVAGLFAGVLLLPAALLAPPWQVLPLIVLSALAETMYALLLSAAYQRGALAVAYPIARGTAPLLVTLGGWLVLSQQPGPLTVAGALLLLTGLTLVALAGRLLGQVGAVLFAVLTGVAIASYSLIDARAVQTVSPIAYLGPVLGLQGLLLLGLLRVDVKRLRPAVVPGIQIAVGSVASYMLVLFAFQQAHAGQVATLREVSVLIGVFLSRGKRGWQVWLGAALVVAGMIFTAL